MQALPGFHVHNEGRVVANDAEGRERLAKYLIRPPVSLERLTYDRENQQVFYQGKDQTSTYQPLDFLAYVGLHIPDKGEQVVRYYGWFSNKSRGDCGRKEYSHLLCFPLPKMTSPPIRSGVGQHGQD